jgi:hypothetical protein
MYLICVKLVQKLISRKKKLAIQPKNKLVFIKYGQELATTEKFRGNTPVLLEKK